MSDPIWDEYVEAVRGIGGLPDLRDERKRQATAEEEAAVRRARAELDAEQRQCAGWSLLARRAIANAEARLVAAQVMVPDAAAAPAPPSGSTAELAALVQQTERELDADLVSLEAARRRARQQDEENRRLAAERADRRRGMIKFALFGAAIVGVILLIALLAG